jgi:hypothetical protein
MIAMVLVFAAATPSDDCPKTLKTVQSMRDVPAGWHPFIDTTNTRHVLEQVAFYDGSPKDLAALKPDNGDTDEDPVWTFGARAAGRAIWQVCAYSQTAVTLARAIPDTVKKCRIEKKKPEDGLHVVCSTI